MLNKEQKLAVEHGEGPLLIVAGAGTGKTKVITERIKWLIDQKLAKPEEILALTFTEKAAKEMEERVDIALPYGTFGMWIMTFHSFCDRVLKNEGLQIGLNPHFKLLTEAESYLLVKKNFWKFNLTQFRPSGNPYKFIEGMIQHFSRLKDEDVRTEDYKNDEYPELVEAYKTYEKLKVDEGVMDFSDLISNSLKLFRERKNVLERYKKTFKYILVDEFQDTNYAQYQLIKLLAPDNSNLTVVGDDSQSIYKFRGAAISNILSFMKDYPKAKQIVLTKNYRSTQTILDAAYKLIKHNDPDTLEAKLGICKNLESQIEGSEEIELIRTERIEQEADEVIKLIKTNKANKTRKYEWSDFAILVRANNHSDAFVRALERARIPFQFLGPGALFKQPEVKDLIAYLKVLADFTDSVSLYRVLSMDIFKFKQRDLIEILNKAKKINVSLFEVLEKITGHSGGRSPIESDENEEMLSLRSSMMPFVDMIHRHQELVNKETGGQIIYYFLEDSGILKNIVNFEERKAQNIAKFFDKLKTFESVNPDASVFNIVEYLDLAMDMGESPQAAEIDWVSNNAVNIMTLHSAKGLEFPVVIMPNLVEGRLPTRERKEQIPIPDNMIKDILPVGDYHLEEERRLFYVGMTRAKKKLIFSAANFYGEGKRERKLSPFVTEAGVEETRNKFQDTKEYTSLSGWDKKIEKNDKDKDEIKVDFLSYSAIETFRNCPLHYKLKNILKIPTPMSAAQAMGNSIHEALANFYTDKGDLLECLDKSWKNEGFKSKLHEKQTREKAEKFLREYLKSELHKKAKPILLEKSFNFRIDPTLKILGKFDRVDDLGNDQIEVIDYKTGANVPTQKDIDRDLQMSIYAIAGCEVLQKPIEKVKLSFYYFDTGEKVTTTRTKEQLEEVKKELLKIRDEIQSSNFACSKSMICENCEFKMMCG